MIVSADNTEMVHCLQRHGEIRQKDMMGYFIVWRLMIWFSFEDNVYFLQARVLSERSHFCSFHFLLMYLLCTFLLLVAMYCVYFA